jgi:hypothetical protein
VGSYGDAQSIRSLVFSVSSSDLYVQNLSHRGSPKTRPSNGSIVHSLFIVGRKQSSPSDSDVEEVISTPEWGSVKGHHMLHLEPDWEEDVYFDREARREHDPYDPRDVPNVQDEYNDQYDFTWQDEGAYLHYEPDLDLPSQLGHLADDSGTGRLPVQSPKHLSASSPRQKKRSSVNMSDSPGLMCNMVKKVASPRKARSKGKGKKAEHKTDETEAPDSTDLEDKMKTLILANEELYHRILRYEVCI